MSSISGGVQPLPLDPEGGRGEIVILTVFDHCNVDRGGAGHEGQGLFFSHGGVQVGAAKPPPQPPKARAEDLELRPARQCPTRLSPMHSAPVCPGATNVGARGPPSIAQLPPAHTCLADRAPPSDRPMKPQGCLSYPISAGPSSSCRNSQPIELRRMMGASLSPHS